MRTSVNLSIEKVVDRSEEFLRGVKKLTQSSVLVGIPEGEGDRQEGEISNAALLYIHDHGSPSQNIPPRPVIEPGIKNAQDDILARMKELGIAALNGNASQTNKLLHAIGLIAQNSLRARVTEGPFVPLSARTLRRRRSKGKLSEKPLIFSGQMRNAISYVVEEE